MNQIEQPPEIEQGANIAYKSDNGEYRTDKLTLRHHKQTPKTSIDGNMGTNKQTPKTSIDGNMGTNKQVPKTSMNENMDTSIQTE